jgi:AAA domain, putative AbiEii toxin, Type IV TA system
LLCYFSPWREPPHRQRPRVKLVGPPRRLDGYLDALDLHADFKDFAAWFKSFEERPSKAGARPPAVEAVRRAVISCIPGCTDLRWVSDFNDIVITIASTTADGDIDGRGARYGDSGGNVAGGGDGDGSGGSRDDGDLPGGTTHLIWRLSDGFLNPGLGEDVAQNVDGVVLIDEIDLHLHPRWQRRVVSDLRAAFPRVQFIATTHSPFVVQSMGADEVINLDRASSLDFQHSSVEDIVEVEMGVEGVQRSQVFHAKVAAAREYLAALEGRPKDDAEVARLKNRLDKLQVQFGNDPVYVASLLQKRAAKGLE